MGAYRSAENPDRLKAAAGVALVHAGLAALILSGLTVSRAVHHADVLKVFDLRADVPPPPIEQPRPRPATSAAPKNAPAPANIRSTPTDVVAPRRVSLPVPLPINAALAPGQGADPSAGSSSMHGSGTGAGGQGNGSGGGGTGGSGQGFTPARLLNKIPDSDYRRITANRMRRGSADIALRVGADGSASNCRIVRSSGDPVVDGILCEVATNRLRFSPARDPQGRPVAQDIRYTPTWRPN
jgi:protein TonB